MDYLRHVEEMTHFAQAIETDVRGTKTTVNAIVLHVPGSRPRTEIRTYLSCSKVGHIATDCWEKKKKNKDKGHRREDNIIVLVLYNFTNV